MLSTIFTDAVSEAQLVAGFLAFVASYVVFAFGKFPGTKIDRPGMAIIGAVLMFAFRILHAGDSLRYIDFATIVLLCSMMLIVGHLRLAGFFDRVARAVVGGLGSKHLLPAVIVATGVLSAFFVNDIVCLVMVPFVLSITRQMQLRPLRYVLAVATASNVGSVATITGNPQNILIGSLSRIGYREFLAHLGPVALAGMAVVWLVLRWYPDSGPHLPKESRGGAPSGTSAIAVMPAQGRRATDPKPQGLAKPVIVVVLVLIGFLAGISPALVAAVGAAVLLITRTREPRLVYDEVDWGLLVFFIGLFLIVGGAERIGLINAMFDVARTLRLEHIGILTGVTAVLSNIVSNVPAVMMLKSLVPGFQNPHQSWLVLAMASTLAGNLTITGSIANIIVVERARPEVEISFRDYLRAGVPITVVTLLIGWAWLAWVR